LIGYLWRAKAADVDTVHKDKAADSFNVSKVQNPLSFHEAQAERQT
jgi:hypothetical protein